VIENIENWQKVLAILASIDDVYGNLAWSDAKYSP
jgi:hypothetical protein